MSKTVEEIKADLAIAEAEERKVADARREREQQAAVLIRRRDELRAQAIGELAGSKLLQSRAEQRLKNSEALQQQAEAVEASIQALEIA